MTFDASTIGSKFCVYLRKSRADEEHEKLTGLDTLNSHRTTLYDFADRLGIIVSEEYAEVASGESLIERPEMMRLLNDLENNRWDGVLVMSVDRLSRGSVRHQGIIAEAFMDSETYILTPTRIFDPLSDSDMEIFDFDLFMSRRELKTINRRLIAGRIASCRRGEYIASEAPYGYAKTRINGMKSLVPDDRAKHVKTIYKLYLQGTPMGNIAKILTAEGVPTARPESAGGSRWNIASVKNILTNPVYAGLIRWNNTKYAKTEPESGRKRKVVPNDSPLIFEGLHEPIISREDYDAVQRMFEAHTSPFANGRVERNYYGGLLFCAKCGKALSYYASKDTHSFLHVNGFNGCSNKGVKVAVMDNAIIEWLTSVVEDMEMEIEREIAPDNKSRVKELEKEAAHVRRLMAETMDMLEEGAITEQDFAYRQTMNAEKLRVAQYELDKARRLSEERKVRTVRLHDAITALRDPEFDVRAKNMLLRSVIKRIDYTNDSKQGHNDKMVLEITLL